jgi:uncharacterized membrane protein YcaP (DUF421 family)
MMDQVFFSGWEALLRTGIIAILGYPLMLLMVRLSGHRTLAQMNAFDLIVTVALGSTLASVISSQDIALAQGLLAFALLIILQFVIAKSAARWSRVEALVNGEPVLLLHDGRFLKAAMSRARITEEEIRSSIRAEGHSDVNLVKAVVLETNGTMSVVWREGSDSALASVPDGNRSSGN